MSQTRIRNACRADLPDILQIYSHEVHAYFIHL